MLKSLEERDCKVFPVQPNLQGLCAATKARVSLIRDLLRNGLLCVATRRISQDSLESYFGHQRSFGRGRANPSIYAFGYRRSAIVLKRRDGVLKDVLGLEDVLEGTFSSPWPWPRRSSPLALASKP